MQLKGQAQQKRGKLTHDDWDVVEGKRDELADKVQARYGYQKDRAENDLLSSKSPANAKATLLT